MNELLDLLIEEGPTLNEILQMISPAYAEVDCNSGAYTGYRYPYDEAGRATPPAPLYEGDRFYIKKKAPNGKSCLYT